MKFRLFLVNTDHVPFLSPLPLISLHHLIHILSTILLSHASFSLSREAQRRSGWGRGSGGSGSNELRHRWRLRGGAASAAARAEEVHLRGGGGNVVSAIAEGGRRRLGGGRASRERTEASASAAMAEGGAAPLTLLSLRSTLPRQLGAGSAARTRAMDPAMATRGGGRSGDGDRSGDERLLPCRHGGRILRRHGGGGTTPLGRRWWYCSPTLPLLTTPFQIWRMGDGSGVTKGGRAGSGGGWVVASFFFVR